MRPYYEEGGIVIYHGDLHHAVVIEALDLRVQGLALGHDFGIERDTGTRIPVARTPLDRMIDEATGANEAVVRAFVGWFNEHIWGEL